MSGPKYFGFGLETPNVLNDNGKGNLALIACFVAAALIAVFMYEIKTCLHRGDTAYEQNK